MKEILLAVLIFTAVAGALGSCQNDLDTTLDDTPSTAPQYGPNFKFYTDSNLFSESQTKRSSDPSNQYAIESVKRENNKLKIAVNYNGGCKDHNFDIVWDGVVNLSYPGKVNLIVKHNANGDTCEGTIHDVIEVDLDRYFDNIIDSNNTLFVVSNASSIQEVSSSTVK
jgi:hypothetical protein